MRNTWLLLLAWFITLSAWYVGRQAYLQVQDLKQDIASLQTSQSELTKTWHHITGELTSTSQKRLLSYLKLLPPTIILTDAVGNRVDITQPISLPAYGLQVRLVVPDTLYKMFPDAWKYEMSSTAMSFRKGRSVSSIKNNDNAINLMALKPQSGDWVDVVAKEVFLVDSVGKRVKAIDLYNQISFIVILK